jgi:Xaa-Pro aminopeptidase
VSATGRPGGSPPADVLALVRAAMRRAEIDALVLRPSPDFRFLGGSGEDFLVLTHDEVRETSDPRVCVPGRARRVGVDAEMRVRELFGLGIDAELVPASAVLSPLRLRKRPDEIEALARAAASAEAVLRQSREMIWFGASEQTMAASLRVLMVESGCEEVLDLRVAAGEHTALPAHRPSGRVINPGDAVQVAVCGRWDGYCAEVARVFAVAEPPEDFEAMYSVVHAAHAAAIAAVRPGLPVAGLAATVAGVIDSSGYGRFAGARCGRGVGRGHDEPPRVSEADDAVLGDGVTLCLEPAIYVPELFGARLADVMVCVPGGALALSTPPGTVHVLDR